jgi:hypothetical protein
VFRKHQTFSGSEKGMSLRTWRSRRSSQPKRKQKNPFRPDTIERIAEENNFPSRQTKAPKEPRRKRRVYTTGRNRQFNIKATAETVKRFYKMADEDACRCASCWKRRSMPWRSRSRRRHREARAAALKSISRAARRGGTQPLMAGSDAPQPPFTVLSHPFCAPEWGSVCQPWPGGHHRAFNRHG